MLVQLHRRLTVVHVSLLRQRTSPIFEYKLGRRISARPRIFKPVKNIFSLRNFLIFFYLDSSCFRVLAFANEDILFSTKINQI